MKESDSIEVPPEISNAIAKSSRVRERTILKQIALVEMGASQYYTERSMIEDFGMTEDQLARLKETRRSDIDGFKRGFEEGKFRISSEINERLKLTEALRMAVTTGDKKTGDSIKVLLRDLETFVPIRLIEQMWNVMDKIKKSDEPQVKEERQGGTNIQIINSSMAEAERLIAERKKIPAIESTPVETQKL